MPHRRDSAAGRRGRGRATVQGSHAPGAGGSRGDRSCRPAATAPPWGLPALPRPAGTGCAAPSRTPRGCYSRRGRGHATVQGSHAPGAGGSRGDRSCRPRRPHRRGACRPSRAQPEPVVRLRRGRLAAATRAAGAATPPFRGATLPAPAAHGATGPAGWRRPHRRGACRPSRAQPEPVVRLRRGRLAAATRAAGAATPPFKGATLPAPAAHGATGPAGGGDRTAVGPAGPPAPSRNRLCGSVEDASRLLRAPSRAATPPFKGATLPAPAAHGATGPAGGGDRTAVGPAGPPAPQPEPVVRLRRGRLAAATRAAGAGTPAVQGSHAPGAGGSRGGRSCRWRRPHRRGACRPSRAAAGTGCAAPSRTPRGAYGRGGRRRRGRDGGAHTEPGCGATVFGRGWPPAPGWVNYAGRWHAAGSAEACGGRAIRPAAPHRPVAGGRNERHRPARFCHGGGSASQNAFEAGYALEGPVRLDRLGTGGGETDRAVTGSAVRGRRPRAGAARRRPVRARSTRRAPRGRPPFPAPRGTARWRRRWPGSAPRRHRRRPR